MFRMWGKIIKNTKTVKDTIICISDYSMSRTSMVFQSLEEICLQFDLEQPIWLDSNIEDFKRRDKPVSIKIILLNLWILTIWKFK